MAYALNGRLGVDFTATSTTPEAALGEQLEASDGNCYEYVKASAAIDQYAAVAIAEDGTAQELTTTISGSVPTNVGVAQVAIASGSYGWAVRKGREFTVLGAASCAANVVLYTTATAGVVDDAATDAIVGLRLNETLTGAAAASASAVTFMRTN